ncbi:MAG: hypothetical protein WKF61_06720 [Luteimonas sp.]
MCRPHHDRRRISRAASCYTLATAFYATPLHASRQTRIALAVSAAQLPVEQCDRC